MYVCLNVCPCLPLPLMQGYRVEDAEGRRRILPLPLRNSQVQSQIVVVRQIRRQAIGREEWRSQMQRETGSRW